MGMPSTYWIIAQRDFCCIKSGFSCRPVWGSNMVIWHDMGICWVLTKTKYCILYTRQRWGLENHLDNWRKNGSLFPYDIFEKHMVTITINNPRANNPKQRQTHKKFWIQASEEHEERTYVQWSIIKFVRYFHPAYVAFATGLLSPVSETNKVGRLFFSYLCFETRFRPNIELLQYCNVLYSSVSNISCSLYLVLD